MVNYYSYAVTQLQIRTTLVKQKKGKSCANRIIIKLFHIWKSNFINCHLQLEEGKNAFFRNWIWSLDFYIVCKYFVWKRLDQLGNAKHSRKRSYNNFSQITGNVLEFSCAAVFFIHRIYKPNIIHKIIVKFKKAYQNWKLTSSNYCSKTML